MSNQLAVDIVLLPPKEVMQSIIGLIDYSPESVIKLDMHSCLPHISLVMGVMQNDSIEAAKVLLDKLADKYVAMDLSLVANETHTIPGNLKMNDVTVEKDEPLLSLATDVMSTFEPLLAHDNVTTDMFTSPPKVAEVSTSWVQNYYQNNKIPDGFRPHITLGEGEVKNIATPITFRANRLALCHLGNYCTCRKTLVETKLSAS
jgi:hypothetical protein